MEFCILSWNRPTIKIQFQVWPILWHFCNLPRTLGNDLGFIKMLYLVPKIGHKKGPKKVFSFRWGLFYNILLYLARNPMKITSFPLKFAWFLSKIYQGSLKCTKNSDDLVIKRTYYGKLNLGSLRHFVWKSPPVHYIWLTEAYIGLIQII
jgi:hypothetical protein